MNKYRIKYVYDTGDSYHTEYNRVGYLEITWCDLDTAKDNLRKIKEHYQYYLDIEKASSFKEIKTIKKIASQRDWFVKKYEACFCLTTDKGSVVQIYAPWCGYFEKLNEVEIEVNNADMKVSFR